MSDTTPSDTPARKPRKATARKRNPATKQTVVATTTTAAAAEVGTGEVELIRVPMAVRWRDLDAFNHVNNSQYLSYLEEARLQWMLSVPGQGVDEHVAPVVAAAQLNYRRPIQWPAELTIELFVERLGNTSVSIGHRIVDANDGAVLYCDGHVVMVWIDRGTGKAATLPVAVREACSVVGNA